MARHDFWFFFLLFFSNVPPVSLGVKVTMVVKAPHPPPLPVPTCPPLRDPSGYKVNSEKHTPNYNCTIDFCHIVPRKAQLLQMAILHEHYRTKWTFWNTILAFFGLLKELDRFFMTLSHYYRPTIFHTKQGLKSRQMKIMELVLFFQEQQFSSEENISSLSSTVRVLLFHWGIHVVVAISAWPPTLSWKNIWLQLNLFVSSLEPNPYQRGPPVRKGDPQVKGNSLVLITVPEHEEKIPPRRKRICFHIVWNQSKIQTVEI